MYSSIIGNPKGKYLGGKIMLSTMEKNKLSMQELQRCIMEFTQSHNTGALATQGSADLRVSPIRYFSDSELNIYLISRGGGKFENLEENNEVCFLIASPFENDHYAIEGVQFFGQAQVLESHSKDFEIALELCPWNLHDQTKIIKLKYERAIYVDRLSGKNIKQEWVSNYKA